MSKRILLVAATTGYQTRMFGAAAERAGVDLVMATDRCHVLDDPWGDQAIAVRFEDPLQAGQAIASAGRADGIIAVGDRPALIAAHAAEALGLAYNSPAAVEISRNKHAARERFRAAGLPTPEFWKCDLHADPKPYAEAAQYPCVLKPLGLSMSRGVIRADNESQFIAAFARVRAILEEPELVRLQDQVNREIQVETFIPGREYAMEGVVSHGLLQVFAIFEKPDPLDGPFFEETIYVTPPRAGSDEQQTWIGAVSRAVQAIGLTQGPVHAEFRVNSRGVWMLEVAARPIGGLCAKAVRFEGGIGLEEVLLRHAAGEDVSGYRIQSRASGVMMIPVPAEGIYRSVSGEERAAQTPGITEVAITAKDGQRLRKLPEGNSYLGFLFGEGDNSKAVEQALRSAHKQLGFEILPELPVN